MRFSSILLLIFLFIIKFEYTFSLWKKAKDTLENYIIDVLFSNSLTILRCNPYERQLLRDITIENVGRIRCSNKHLFLPENHIEDITLLQWNYTSIECSKNKKTINEEKTYLYIKHKAKNAFKKLNFDLVRVGSTGDSKYKVDEKKFLITFNHPPRNLAMAILDQENETFTTEIYAFKHRPILCRERQLASGSPCTTNQHQNLSYICYYKMGVAEPPTIAELESELKTLPKDIDSNANSELDRYIDKTPKHRSSWGIFPILGITIAIFVIIVLIGIVVYCCCCQSKSGIRHIDSDTSNLSNIS